jgi:sec-independent protein translocase protein TatA
MSLVHWLVVAVIVILLFGGSRFSNMMGDVAKGIKQFKKGMAEEDETPAGREPTRIEAQKAAEPAYKSEAERVREDR